MHAGATESEFDIFKALSNPKRIDLNKASVVSRALEREISEPKLPPVELCPPVESCPPVEPCRESRPPVEPCRESRPPVESWESRSEKSVRSVSERSYKAADDMMDRQASLVELNQLKMQGILLSREFTMSDSLADMTFEINRIRSKTMAAEAAVVGTTMLRMVMLGTETANRKWGPILNLDGWSNTVKDNQESYNSVFSRLYRKHFSKGGQISPEVQLAGMLGASAFMTHVGQTTDFDSMKKMASAAFMANPVEPKQEGAFTKRPTMRKPTPMPEPVPPPPPDIDYKAEVEELRRERAVLQSQLRNHSHFTQPPVVFMQAPMTSGDIEILE